LVALDCFREQELIGTRSVAKHRDQNNSERREFDSAEAIGESYKLQ
jgi:hypothetical protein